MAERHDRELMAVVEAFAAGDLSRRSLLRRLGSLSAGAIFGGALAARSGESAPAAGRQPKVSASRGRYQDDPPAQRGGTVVAATIDKPVKARSQLVAMNGFTWAALRSIESTTMAAITYCSNVKHCTL